MGHERCPRQLDPTGCQPGSRNIILQNGQHPDPPRLLARGDLADNFTDDVTWTIIGTGEFLGMAGTGKSVQVPYCVVYDLDDDKIAALRAYIPMELSIQQLK